MRRRPIGFLSFILFWGCGGAPFLIANFEADYKPKLKTIAVMPFSFPAGSWLAQNRRPVLEEKITDAIVRSDSLRSYLLPAEVRARLEGMADSAIQQLPGDRLGKRLTAETLLHGDVIRLHQAEGDNPTTRQIGGAKYQRRGVELLMEFRLVKAASGRLLWRYRVRRFAKDVETAGQQVAQAAARAWPLGRLPVLVKGIDGSFGVTDIPFFRSSLGRANGNRNT